MSGQKVILLLGRRDQPTDGVADYCEQLRPAGSDHGLDFEIVTVPWDEKGWSRALSELQERCAAWAGAWVLLQYTALAWSRRGFPFYAARIVNLLLAQGARASVVFHDAAPAPPAGVLGGLREFFQLRVARQLYSRAELSIFPVALNQISWLPLRRAKAFFIPIGANCPPAACLRHEGSGAVKTVAVYSITGGAQTSAEIADLSAALRRAARGAGQLRAVIFGRGSREGEPGLRAALAGANIELESLSLIPPEEVTRVLSTADVLLFVRGPISTRRGSALAGVACGLPIVCYAGTETAWPITEAGIVAVPLGDREALGAALENVLCDGDFRRKLARKSWDAQAKYFSWDVIAKQYAAVLQQSSKETTLAVNVHTAQVA